MSRLGTSELRIAALTVGSLLAISTFAAAQTVSGTITGTAIDPSSLPVAGAGVTLTNSDTGVRLAEKTGANGEFIFTAVLPGRYHHRGDERIQESGKEGPEP